MDTQKKARLESAGWKVGTTADFLGLSPAEEALIETRIALTKLLRESREASGLTQKQLAETLHTQQSGIARMESGHHSVSLDKTLRALFALGVLPHQIGAVMGQLDSAAKTRETAGTSR